MAHTPETCTRCGSLLFPPHLVPELKMRVAVDFVCPNCGRAYLCNGTPRTLIVVSPRADEDERDQGSRCSLELASPAEEYPTRPTSARLLSLVPRRPS